MSRNGPATVVDCSSAFAARVAPHVDALCTQKGLLPGDQVLMVDRSTDVACRCVCGAQDGINPVATPAGDRPMSALRCGDLVLAAGPELAWLPTPVRFSAGAVMATVSDQLVRIRLVGGGGTVLYVLPDHTFLIPGSKLIRARDLTVGGALIQADGRPAEIVACDRISGYRGYVWRIATSDEAPAGLDGHLLNTSGVASGDYAVQLFFDQFARAGLVYGAQSAA